MHAYVTLILCDLREFQNYHASTDRYWDEVKSIWEKFRAGNPCLEMNFSGISHEVQLESDQVHEQESK
jgi:hypothetical protein